MLRKRKREEQNRANISSFETNFGVRPYMRILTVTTAHHTLLLDDRHEFHMVNLSYHPYSTCVTHKASRHTIELHFSSFHFYGKPSLHTKVSVLSLFFVIS